MIIILENANYRDALAQPFLSNLAKRGALLSEFYAEARPSLPNYIALTAGTTAGLTSNAPVSLDLHHIGDLLEGKGKTWKVYAEAYPGHCFLGERSGTYVRKHVPFLSFENVRKIHLVALTLLRHRSLRPILRLEICRIILCIFPTRKTTGTIPALHSPTAGWLRPLVPS